MESFIESHYSSEILGVFSGHSHLFNAFRRNYTQFIVAGNGGGKPDQVNDSSVMGPRVWNTENLTGPLTPDNDSRIGYDSHLHSWVRHTRTEVFLDGNSVSFVVRDLDSWIALANYTYRLEKERSWGPIVTPRGSGANITWWTHAAMKT